MKFFIITIFIFCLIGCSTENNQSVASKKENKPASIPKPIIEFNPEKYVCYRADSPLKIDGKMNESAWQDAAWTVDFLDIQGTSKPKPRFRTRAKMLWDDTFFYIFAEMEEPDVWATLKKRDSIIFFDNDFEVFIDPDGDSHRYYELEINAFSTEWDLFLDKPYRDQCRVLFNWDYIGMKSAVSVQGTINRPGDKDQGWTLEIALPWEVLKECAEPQRAPKSGEQWRVNFSRVEWKTEVVDGKYQKVINPETGKPFPEDNWVWSPQGIINMHYPEMWAFVQFSEKVSGEGTDEFRYQKQEDVKWALRKIYYAEKAIFDQTGKYSNLLKDLNLDFSKVDGYNWPPKIQTTQSFFEAVLTSQDNSHQWHISQDGRTWRESELK